MSTFRLSLALATVIAMTAPFNVAFGQALSGINTHPRGPFIEPDTFQPDFQFFAPSDVTDYTAHPKGPTGFYFQYERLYMNVSRPRNPPNSTTSNDYQFDGDFTWGNRLEGGFRQDDGKGWTIVGWHIDGPNANFTYNSGDAIQPFARAGVDPNNPNDPLLLQIVNSQNVATYSSLEINRVFESHTFHNGGILEPFIGLKYSQFTDHFTATAPGFGSPGTPPISYVSDGVNDQLTFTRGGNQNNMLGAQLGARIYKEVGHWQFNAELRAFAMENAQLYNEVNDWNATGTSVLIRTPTAFASHANTTVWGGELKSDVAYKLTRDISFNVGFALLDFAQGIGRVSHPQPTSLVFNPLESYSTVINNNASHLVQKDVFMGGITFGFQVNH